MPPTLAAVFAHPDDETYSMGGTTFLHTRRGGEFAMYCATDGDAGHTSGLLVSSRTATATYFLAARATEYPEQLGPELAPPAANRPYYVT
jgi:N-acetyl-1-D-myo-inositol-2-amino-2-deoxy-alpha-D-glucopyranoside deacetylase